MAYVSATDFGPEAEASPPAQSAAAVPSDAFSRLDQLIVVLGAAGLGAMAGLFGALLLGRTTPWLAFLASTPFLIIAFHFTVVTLCDASERKARGCWGAAIVSVAIVLAWAMAGAFVPAGSALYFVAPGLALASLVMFATCWRGSSRAIYRIAGEGALLGVVAAHQGLLAIMS